jgi:hypothetical protein
MYAPSLAYNDTGATINCYGLYFPADTAYVHSAATQLAIVGWRSPVPVGGYVSISGSASDIVPIG